jgi:hypothetical protein
MAASGRKQPEVPAPIRELLASWDIEKVEPNAQQARSNLTRSIRGLKTAASVADDDPDSAIELIHSAVRKGITAVMLADGYRPKQGGEGTHVVVIRYGRAVLTALGEDVWDDVDDLRKDRHRSEYGLDDRPAFFAAADARSYVATAKAILGAANKRIGPPPKR